MSSPSKMSWPLAGATSPDIAFSVVVLPAAVGADQRDEVAFMNFERKVADRGYLPVAAGQAFNRQHERAFRLDKHG